jgi:hypothetical protein
VQSGDIDIKLVEQIKAKYKNRQLPFTEKDIEAEKTAE